MARHEAVGPTYTPETVLVSVELGMIYRVGGDQATLGMFPRESVDG